jgi:hypothetical protein
VAKFSDVRTAGRSRLVPFNPNEGHAERHQRRLAENQKGKDYVEAFCGRSSLKLVITNNWNHWSVYPKAAKPGDPQWAEWWPSSAKLVFRKQWKQGIHVHDYLQFVAELQKRLEVETPQFFNGGDHQMSDYSQCDAGQGDAVDTLEAPASFQGMLKEFVALEHERRQHDDRLKQIAERVDKLAPTLLDQFADAGIQNANVDGLTVYVRVDRYVSKRGDASTEQVCQVLKDCGLGYMVSDGYNASSLKSKVKEFQEEGVAVPEALAAMLNIGEVPRLATRKA